MNWWTSLFDNNTKFGRIMSSRAVQSLVFTLLSLVVLLSISTLVVNLVILVPHIVLPLMFFGFLWLLAYLMVFE
jgi:hypothetical protein